MFIIFNEIMLIVDEIFFSFKRPIILDHERTTKTASVTRNASFFILRTEVQN